MKKNKDKVTIAVELNPKEYADIVYMKKIFGYKSWKEMLLSKEHDLE